MEGRAIKIIDDFPVEKVMNSGYTPIKDLLVYSFGYHRGVLVLRAYFDESGQSHDSAFVCFGGCVASVESWTEFEKEWQQTLNTFGISCFHMTDFESHRGLFRGWEKKRKKHKQLIANLIDIMQSHTELYIGASENVAEYNLMKEPKDDPYFNCLMVCLDSASSYVSRLGVDEKVEMIFADHPQHSNRVRRLYPQVRDVGGMYKKLAFDGYGSPSEILPLQAADIVAFEVRKECERKSRGYKRPQRWPLQQLIMKKFSWGGYFI